MNITITNPSTLAGTRWAEVAIPGLHDVPMRDDHGVVWWPQEQTGVSTLYAGRVTWSAGESVAWRTLEPYKDAQPEPFGLPVTLEDLRAAAEWQLEAHGLSRMEPSGWAETRRTPQRVRFHSAYRGGRSAHIARVDVWADVYTGQRAVRIRALATIGNRNLTCPGVSLYFGAEIRTDAERWHGLLPGPRSLSWIAPEVRPGERMLAACTTLALDGYLLVRDRHTGEGDPVADGYEIRDPLTEQELHAFRFGPSLGMASADDWEGHWPVLGKVPRSSAYVSPRWIGDPGNWWDRRRWAGNLDATQPGDSDLFGSGQCAQLFCFNGSEHLRETYWAAMDMGLRHVHHVAADGQPFRQRDGDGLRTYSDVEDPRVSANVLGVHLPETNIYGRDTHDEEHYDDIVPEAYAVTACPMLKRIGDNRLQMVLAYRRRWDPWSPVSRAMGRVTQTMVSYWLVFPEHRSRIKNALDDFLRLIARTWSGKATPDAWFRPLKVQTYGGGPAISPWQEALGARGLYASHMHGLLPADAADELRGAIFEACRAVVRCFTYVDGRWCTPYYVPYTDSPDPQPIHNASVTEIQTWWCYPAVAILARMDVNGPDGDKARTILATWPQPQTLAQAQWGAV